MLKAPKEQQWVHEGNCSKLNKRQNYSSSAWKTCWWMKKDAEAINQPLLLLPFLLSAQDFQECGQSVQKMTERCKRWTNWRICFTFSDSQFSPAVRQGYWRHCFFQIFVRFLSFAASNQMKITPHISFMITQQCFCHFYIFSNCSTF